MVAEKVPELSDEKEFNDFIKEGNVLVDFYAEWCMPCLMMGPVVDELSEKLKGKIKFAKVNVGDNQEIARKFNVSSIPNFILFKNGKPAENFVGAIQSDDFEEKLKSLI